MDILICSRLFYPANEIGAVRPSNMARYLNEFGHKVSVITSLSESAPKHDLFPGSIHIERVGNSKFILKLIARIENGNKNKSHPSVQLPGAKQEKNTAGTKFFSWFKALRLQVYTIIIETDWYFQAKKIIDPNQKEKAFDIVISSFGPISSHLLGRFVKSRKYARYWIADLRDNMQNEDFPSVINSVYHYFEKDALRRADAITLISEGQSNMFKKSVGIEKFAGNKINVIHNGYEDRIKVNRITNKTGVLNITYTGALYEGKRDISMLFEAITHLKSENKVDYCRLCIHYAGPSSAEFIHLADSYAITGNIIDHGQVTRQESLNLQWESDILVVLSWNSKKEQGILTGKFMEYLQSSKPLIALTCGNLPGAELTGMVERLKLGIGCEYLNKDVDIIRLKEFLLKHYTSIIHGESVHFEPDSTGIEEFHYPVIFKKFETICNRLVS